MRSTRPARPSAFGPSCQVHRLVAQRFRSSAGRICTATVPARVLQTPAGIQRRGSLTALREVARPPTNDSVTTSVARLAALSGPMISTCLARRRDRDIRRRAAVDRGNDRRFAEVHQCHLTGGRRACNLHRRHGALLRVSRKQTAPDRLCRSSTRPRPSGDAAAPDARAGAHVRHRRTSPVAGRRAPLTPAAFARSALDGILAETTITASARRRDATATWPEVAEHRCRSRRYVGFTSHASQTFPALQDQRGFTG